MGGTSRTFYLFKEAHATPKEFLRVPLLCHYSATLLLPTSAERPGPESGPKQGRESR